MRQSLVVGRWSLATRIERLASMTSADVAPAPPPAGPAWEGHGSPTISSRTEIISNLRYPRLSQIEPAGEGAGATSAALYGIVSLTPPRLGQRPKTNGQRRFLTGLVLGAWCLVLALPLSARTLTDELGRTVAITDHPHRIICLAPSLTDTVYALGHGADVAGVTDFTAYPAEVKKKPSIGGVVNPSLETIVALKPDLVLAIVDMNSRDTIRALEREHLAVFAVRPAGMEGAYRSILSVGTALNDSAGAQMLVERLRARQRQVAARMAGRPRPSVLLVLWPDPFITAGRGAFITDLIEAAGAHSVTADFPREWVHLNLESILAKQPRYLLLIRDTKVTPEGLRKLPGWSSLEAVRAGRVIWVDDRVYYPSPLMLDALEDLSKQLLVIGNR